MTEKWEAALEGEVFSYDSFFDFSMGFWVQSLEDYILHWQSSGAIKYNMIGIEWTPQSSPSDLHIVDAQFIRSKTFYSILVQTPSSSVHYEFMSWKKPALGLYESIRWIQSGLPRYHV